ncbi:AHH domain-containing protein [Scleromatobacter humisilvae]|uniref:AHH domain-containing protein n=1 Tax=Scleromatobacter humisilvae TaxID=2897159 RepID=A0A9X2C0F3_9BURK|nr:AHH domain-containing protein [Scleromatobacter humisilvae]MCK9687272.1 AHH domain-containing protein [Scleromatobacter humisilvae]
MAKEVPKGSVQALAAPAAELQEQAILANLLMRNDRTVNTYAVRNDRALRKAKSLVCYKNGITKQRVSVKRLQADALAKGSHSQALSGNIQLARGELQPDATDAHHIVARRHHLAAVARGYLFRWKIGIDDADNGVFLPKKLGANVAGLENAVPHGPLHSGPYHFEVTDRLRDRAGEPASAAREELRAMRAEMVAGTFPYMKS